MSSHLSSPAADDEPDGTAEVVSFFDVYRCDAEAIFDIPATDNADPPVQIGIAAQGGGTVGHAYRNNDWIYEVRIAEILVCSGADLHSGDLPRTHRQMAATLAVFLADGDGIPGLRRHRDRLTQWATDSRR